MAGDLLAELRARGLVEQLSAPNIDEILAAKKRTIYIGFDPTADSLQLGHLVPIMLLKHFQNAGHRVLAVVGGTTGMIGDPAGRASERQLLTLETVQANCQAIKQQLGRFLDFSDSKKAALLNNYDWTGQLSFVDWLRDVGKYFPLSVMLAKESVKQRLNSESGISFTEFSYQTVQAYDFLTLYKEEGCELQAGGNDQWGNITAGLDLVRKATGEQVFGLTLPLLTTADGQKFGKSAGNAIWLDAERTSPYEFYQYFIRAQDVEVEKFLKIFTFLPLAEISEIIQNHQQAPEKRAAQKFLAREITTLVHGAEITAAVERCSAALFSGTVAKLDAAAAAMALNNLQVTAIDRAALANGLELPPLLTAAGLSKSNSEARRFLQAGSVYVNDQRVDAARQLTAADLLFDQHIFLRRGKKSYAALSCG